MNFVKRFFRLFLVGFLLSTVGRAQVTFTSSNLPIILIDTHGGTIIDEPKIPATMGIIYNGVGVRNAITDTPNNYNGNIGIEIRGSSSQMFPKKQYGVEIRDVNGVAVDKALLGMPKKDDWVLFAPYDDKSLMRDALAYKLGRDQGRYASRSRFCEVVINGVYEGVYVLLEKVKRDKNRVNIDKMDSTEISGDNLTGGYLIKIDKTTGSGGEGWYSAYAPLGRAGTQTILFLYDYPKQEDIMPEQKAYIKKYVDDFETALAGDNFRDTATGYSKYIDKSSFIDFLIMSEVTKNPDAYRLSTYLYKRKDSDGGKLFMGPIWDFNLGFGNVDYCTQGNPEGFVLDFNSICPWDSWQIPFWWNRLLTDPAFSNQLSARWFSLRSGPFSDTKVLNYIDSVATVLNGESQQRNFTTWPVLGQYVWPNYYVGPTYASEVAYLKNWIIQRLTWMDAHMPTLTTGLTEEPNSFSIRAFPNPFVNEFTWEYEMRVPGTLEIDVVDLMGRSVGHLERSHEKLGKFTTVFTTSALPAGLYFYRARMGRSVFTEKIIKKLQ